MELKRISDAVYVTKYHLIWALKYRKWILRRDIRDFVEQCITEIAISNDFEIEQMQSARASFEKYPEVKKELWGGEFWKDG